MNFHFRKEEKVENEVGVVIMEGAALAQSCVSLKTVGKNFQFRKEEKVENEVGVMIVEGATLAQSCVLLKIAVHKVLKQAGFFFFKLALTYQDIIILFYITQAIQLCTFYILSLYIDSFNNSFYVK